MVIKTEAAKARARAKSRQWRVDHPEYYSPERIRKYWLKRRYGLTPEEFDSLLAKQGGGCALCQRAPKDGGNRLRIDHDHTTGRIRGLLCGPCNSSLGRFGDSVEGLEKAISYLRGER